jgi:hypothetical protein
LPWCLPPGSGDPDRHGLIIAEMTDACRLIRGGDCASKRATRVVSGQVTELEQIATREKCSVRHVNMTISLAFLAPELVSAAVEGRLPRGIGVERLRDAPAEWNRQFEALGLNPQ